MSTSIIPFDTRKPWGHLAPSGWRRAIIKICQCLPATFGFFYTLNKGLRGPIKSAGPRFFDVEVLGLRLRLLTRGNYCETTALFAPQFYDAEEFGWLKSRLGQHSVFVDIGGNVGLYSLVAAASYPGARVVTVEPNLELLERLRFNAATNNLQPEICETALSDYQGSGELEQSVVQSGQNYLATTGNREEAGSAVEFGDIHALNTEHNIEGITEHNTEGNTKNSTENSTANRLQSMAVPVTTLHAVCEEMNLTRIDLLKIDIEGHELRVLEHFIKTADESLYPINIIIEHVHDRDGIVNMLIDTAGYNVAEKSARNVLLVR